MSEEREILTILSREEYDNVLVNLIGEFGEPEKQKRLTLQSDDYDQEDIDTRIRITNGRAELMQKVGDWKNITKGKPRSETAIALARDAETIFTLYKILRNIIGGKNAQHIVMQYESFLWKGEGFEIKLTRQFGKGEAYNCEVEVFDLNLEPKDLAKKYGIPIHLPIQTQEFWKEWNERVNLNAKGMTDEELLKLISGYLG